MIPIHFVGDGARDEAMMPPIVSAILGKLIQPTFAPWSRLNHAGRGYNRKLLFAMRQARDARSAGLVATIDQDKGGKERLDKMCAARLKDREGNPVFPTVLGCAIPHAEAWLLDDPTAMRTVLGLPVQHQIPSVRQVRNPKAAVEAEMASEQHRYKTLIGLVSQQLSPARCAHKQETGFDDFEREVLAELKGL